MSLHNEIFDYQFKTKVDNWVPINSVHTSMFTADELEVLDRSGMQFRTTSRTVVQLSFENNIAAFGGLATVLRHFPAALARQEERVVVVTPLHRGSAKVIKAIEEGALVRALPDFEVNVCSFTTTVSLYEEVGATVPTYNIGIEGRFTAGDNPYGYAQHDDLLFDAFAFCSVVPSALSRMGYTGHLLFHAHDWEAAPIALFARYAVLSGVISNARTVLTLHNSFDSPLTPEIVGFFVKKPLIADTVLQAMLPLIDGPLVAVSTPFAQELCNDPLQVTVFADHLQQLFRKNPPVGIENGMFGKPDVPFSKEQIHAAEAGDYSLLLKKKSSRRAALLKLIRTATDTRISGKLDMSSLESESAPLLFMSGRFDLMQKGYDVIFHGLRRLPRGKVRLLFSPTLALSSDDLSFFEAIAKECEGDITIWPFRIDDATFSHCLLGSSFLVMPSLYEPFGSVSEGLLHGTPLIARATGGLLSQIIPESASAIPTMHRMFFPPHVSDYPNSILYREQCSDAVASSSWRALLNASLEKRAENPLYEAMVEAATAALMRAATIYSQPSEYGRMVLQGLRSVQSTTWERAVKKYRAVYDAAQYRGGR